MKEIPKNVSESVRKRNPHLYGEANVLPVHRRQAAKLESNTGHAPLEAKEVQRPASQKLLVCITSIRKRLLDEDNLCGKFHTDLCRYAGIIPDDSPDKVSIKMLQRKPRKGEKEQVIIAIYEQPEKE